MADRRLIDIPGIGAVTAGRLEAAGVKDLAGLLALPVDSLAGFPGFHAQRAETVLTAARALASSAATSADGDPAALGRHEPVAQAAKKPKKHKDKKSKKKSVTNGKRKSKKEETEKKKDKKSQKKKRTKEKKKKKK
jgi:hypothetical protein